MKILIADDHALFRDGLSLQLEKISPQAVINQAANFSQALKQLESSADVDLIVRGTAQSALILDMDVLVDDHVAQAAVLADHGVLHDDAVLELRSLADLDAAEEHAVLHRALDNAAVRDDAVADARAEAIAGGHIVAHLCVDRAVRVKQLGADLRIHQQHV